MDTYLSIVVIMVCVVTWLFTRGYTYETYGDLVYEINQNLTSIVVLSVGWPITITLFIFSKLLFVAYRRQ